MQNLSIDPEALEAAVELRRDTQHVFANPADRRWISTAFRHRCVLLSSSRIKAEAFLCQN